MNMGIQRIVEHDESGVLSDPKLFEKMKESKEGKDLLNRASAVKPGTKAMENIVKKIRTSFVNEEE
jgi:hypothetical protein